MLFFALSNWEIALTLFVYSDISNNNYSGICRLAFLRIGKTQINSDLLIDDTAEGDLTQFRELFT